jgi:hypothetical protein
VPATRIQHWADEINKHLANNATTSSPIKVHVYKGCYTDSAYVSPEQLATFDICLTTVEVVQHEESISPKKKRGWMPRETGWSTPLIHVDWWRVCLDEPHFATDIDRIWVTLQARNHWCITGTPIKDNNSFMDDLVLMFTFLWKVNIWDFNNVKDSGKLFVEHLFNLFHDGDFMPITVTVGSMIWRSIKSELDICEIENAYDSAASTTAIPLIDQNAISFLSPQAEINRLLKREQDKLEKQDILKDYRPQSYQQHVPFRLGDRVVYLGDLMAGGMLHKLHYRDGLMYTYGYDVTRLKHMCTVEVRLGDACLQFTSEGASRDEVRLASAHRTLLALYSRTYKPPQDVLDMLARTTFWNQNQLNVQNQQQLNKLF